MRMVLCGIPVRTLCIAAEHWDSYLFVENIDVV